MNRKMTLLAFGAKWGGREASGLSGRGAAAARASRAKNPSRDSRSSSPSAVKPPPASQRNSRRVRPQNWPGGRDAGGVFRLIGRPRSPLARRSEANRLTHEFSRRLARAAKPRRQGGRLERLLGRQRAQAFPKCAPE